MSLHESVSTLCVAWQQLLVAIHSSMGRVNTDMLHIYRCVHMRLEPQFVLTKTIVRIIAAPNKRTNKRTK